MIEEIGIKNFRGIEECEISDLSLVNIFVGKNNSGKSTILDAIYIACREPIIAETKGTLFELLRGRCQREIGASELFFNYDDTKAIDISIKLESRKNFALNFHSEKEAVSIESVRYSGPILISQVHDLTTNSWHTLAGYTLSGLDRFAFSHATIDKMLLEYGRGMKTFQSTVKTSEITQQLDEMLSEIKHKGNSENEFNEIISDIYGDFTYEYVPRRENKGDRRATFKQSPQRVYSDFHGLGLQRSALLISTLMLAKNTSMLIEEIEVFQHPKAIEKLSKHMVRLARENNVQLFITSHSYYDALRYFHFAFENSDQREKDFRSFLVQRQNGKVTADKSSYEEIIREVYPGP